MSSSKGRPRTWSSRRCAGGDQRERAKKNLRDPHTARTGFKDSDLWGSYTSGSLPATPRTYETYICLDVHGQTVPWMYGSKGPRANGEQTRASRGPMAVPQPTSVSHADTALASARTGCGLRRVHSDTHTRGSRFHSPGIRTAATLIEAHIARAGSPANVGKQVSCMND